MADSSVKERVSGRLRANFRHRGDDCRDGQKPRHTAAERIEFDTLQRNRRRAIELFQGNDVTEAVIEHESREIYVKPRNGSGYYGYYTTNPDGSLANKLVTFHCSENFQYPEVKRGGKGNYLDMDADIYVPNFVAVGANSVMIDMNEPDYDDEDEEPSAFSVAIEYGFDVLETQENRPPRLIAVYDFDAPEVRSDFVKHRIKAPKSLWHHQDRRDSQEHQHYLACWLLERLAEPTVNDVVPHGGNYFETTDANV